MSISGTAFSSDGVEVITRKIEFTLIHEAADVGRKFSQSDYSNYYEIDVCIKFILDNDYQRVALQFPDHLLCDASRTASRLTEDTAREIFILGDTSYGSCCVDEVAAEHNGADCIIHFGPSCLTRSTRLPVLFVFGKEPVDVEDCGRAFRHAFPATDQHVLVLYDTTYAHCIGELKDTIADHRNCVISQLSLPAPPLSSLPLSATLESNVLDTTSSTTSASTSSTTSTFSSIISSFTSSTSSSSSATSSSTSSMFTTSDVPVTSASHADAYLSRHSGACSCGTSSANSQKSTSVHEGATSNSSTKCRQQQNQGCPPGSDYEDEAENTQGIYFRFGRRYQLLAPVALYEVFYIGMEGPTLTNLMLNYAKCQFSSYNPVTRQCRKETVGVNKALGKRYFLVQKAKEARTVGILVGTLGAADYLEIIERLKKILKQVGKKYYTIAVGKLNVPKIANFLEIDVFVLVACPENSLVDSQDFFKPVVTPYEMEVACLRSKEWTGEYSTDYQELLPGACFHSTLDEVEDDLEPEFSLITGGFVPTKHSSQLEEVDALFLMKARAFSRNIDEKFKLIIEN